MPLTSDETRGSGLAVSIDLINTWDELEPEPDLIEGLTDVRTWLEWHGLSAAAKRMLSGAGRRMGEADVDSVRALRARFDRVFDAGDETEAARRLNELASEYGTPPVLEPADGGWRLRPRPGQEEGLPAVAAYATAGLLAAFQELGWARFGR